MRGPDPAASAATTTQLSEAPFEFDPARPSRRRHRRVQGYWPRLRAGLCRRGRQGGTRCAQPRRPRCGACRDAGRAPRAGCDSGRPCWRRGCGTHGGGSRRGAGRDRRTRQLGGRSQAHRAGRSQCVELVPERLLYEGTKPGQGGNGSLLLTPLELLDRLAALVPPPRIHRHRFFGADRANDCLPGVSVASSTVSGWPVSDLQVRTRVVCSSKVAIRAHANVQRSVVNFSNAAVAAGGLRRPCSRSRLPCSRSARW